MSEQPQENQSQEQKLSDKELNFRKQEEMYQRKLEKEIQERRAVEERLAKLEQQRAQAQPVDDDDDDEPYVDKKRLRKELGKVMQQTSADTDSRIQNAVQAALSEERKNQWLKNNSDFYDVMQHAQKFAERDPELAETILQMPDGFERQKLVYRNIKALGLHEKDKPKSDVQDQIDRNRRAPGYQPSGIGSPGYGVYSAGKDYSPAEGKNAYSKMKELQARLRI